MVNYCFSIIGRIKWLILPVLMLLVSCKDIVEEDISNEIVDVIIPQNGSTSTVNNVHFKWNEMDGADGYRLQIVEPTFDNINTFILDSVVNGLEFYLSLDPGNYQFRIRGENSYYQSIYAGPYSFSVDSTLDLSGHTVPLLTPIDETYSNQTDLTFNWQSIYAADNYDFQVRTGSDFNTGTPIYSVSSITSTAHTTTGSVFAVEGIYYWGVRALNQNTQSNYSSWTINIDQTLPNDVSLISPLDGASSTSDTVVFKWTSGIDPGSVNAPISYVFELDTDIGFGSPTVYTPAVDTLQLVLSTTTYYWRVYAIDEAGNQSAYYSAEYSIIIP